MVWFLSHLFVFQPSEAKIILVDSLCTDKASGYSMQTKIVTCDAGGQRKTHFAYCRVEPDKNFITWETMSVWVATYNHHSDVIESRTCIDEIYDNHGTPCIAVDSDGFLHIVYGPHHHPFIYQKSKYPNNSTEWQDREIISFEYGQINEDNSYWRSKEMIENGKSEWTYPIIKIDRQDQIHVAGSLGHSAGYVRKINSKWEQPRLIYKAKKQLCRYNVMMNIDGRDRIYILAPDMKLNTRSDGYTQCDTEYYLFRSNDHGSSFKNCGLIMSGNVQGNGNLSVDPAGHVHFLCMERNFKVHRWQYHVYYDGKEWQRQKIMVPDRYTWDASMTISQTGRIYILTAANQSDFHWRDASNEIYLFTGEPNVDSDYKFSFRKIIPKKEGLNCWLPNLEENQNHVLFDEKDFFMMWTEEVDLKGKYPSFRNSNLTTRLYVQSINSLMLFDNFDEETKGKTKIDLERR